VTNGVHAFFIEAFGTATLFFVMFALTNIKNPIPGAAIPPIVGAVYGILVAIFAPLTGYERSLYVRDLFSGPATHVISLFLFDRQRRI